MCVSVRESVCGRERVCVHTQSPNPEEERGVVLGHRFLHLQNLENQPPDYTPQILNPNFKILNPRPYSLYLNLQLTPPNLRSLSKPSSSHPPTQTLIPTPHTSNPHPHALHPTP